MGAGESKYVQDQERFVRANIDNYKKVLPDNYSRSQVAGKLRQLYASTDMHERNKYSYISNYEWIKAKSKVVPIYANNAEKNGIRRYH